MADDYTRKPVDWSGIKIGEPPFTFSLTEFPPPDDDIPEISFDGYSRGGYSFSRRDELRVRLGVALLKVGHRLLGMEINSGSFIVRGKEYRW
jgi:hypothetical protein